MKITSTSNKTKRIATRKYLIEKGERAFPCDSIPHSNACCLILVLRFGPSQCVRTITVTTNPSATTAINTIGKYSQRCDVEVSMQFDFLFKASQNYKPKADFLTFGLFSFILKTEKYFLSRFSTKN